MADSVLVYDGSRQLFRTVARTVADRVDGLTVVPWETAGVQRFLEAQFGSRPFAFILVDEDSVHVGEEAVGQVLRDRGVTPEVAALLERGYPAVAEPFGRLVHGQEPADLHGTFELAEKAREHAEVLRKRYDIPVDAE